MPYQTAAVSHRWGKAMAAGITNNHKIWKIIGLCIT